MAASLEAHVPGLLDGFSDVAVAAAIRTPEELDDFLHLVGRRLLGLLGFARYHVFLKDENGVMRGRVADMRDHALNARAGRLVLGGGRDPYTEEILRTQAPVVVTDALHDPRLDPTRMREWGVRAMIGFPLVVSGEVLGLINVDRGDAGEAFGPTEVEVGQIFVSLCALAVHQARLYLELNQKISVVTNQKAVLERLDEIHRRLTAAALGGAQMSDILARIAELLGKPVLLYSPDFELSCWAGPNRVQNQTPPTLPRRSAASPSVASAVRRLTPDRPSTVLQPDPSSNLRCRHLLTALTAEGRTVGYLDVAEVGRPITPLDFRVLEQGAAVVALQLLGERRQAEALGQAAEDFVEDLLQGGRTPRHLERRGALVGVDLREPHVILRLERSGAGDPAASSVERRAAVSAAVERALGGARALTATVPGADVILLPAGAQPALAGLAAHLVATFRDEFGVRMALVSGLCREPDDYPAAHRDLRRLARLASKFGYSGVLDAHDLGVLRLAVDKGGVDASLRFARARVGSLLDHDGPDGALTGTLRTYLDQSGRVRDTARILGVHENTVRYRLARLREIAGIDVEDLDDLLDARFAFRILDLDGTLRSGSSE
ncbi:MAG TPA: helix-turn-helix domain-containing protein [Sporichthya sp.]|nr:helix-turn-helix domain-containing protein [Sporichthya sp.]